MRKEFNKKRYFIYSFVLLIVFIILLVLTKIGKFSVIDKYVYDFIISFKCVNLTNFLKIITNLAGVKFMIFAILLCFVIYIIKYKRLIYLIMVLILSTISNLCLKNLIRIERPVGLNLIDEHGYSFPSGHSMASMSFYGYIIFLICKSNINKKIKVLISIFIGILILIIGVSRIYLGVHNFSDVLAGFVFSGIIILIFSYFFNKKEVE